MSKPINRLKAGKIEMAVWEGDYQGKPTKSYTFQKSYKAQDGTWKNTNYYGFEDLQNIKLLCDKKLLELVRTDDIKEPAKGGFEEMPAEGLQF